LRRSGRAPESKAAKSRTQTLATGEPERERGAEQVATVTRMANNDGGCNSLLHRSFNSPKALKPSTLSVSLNPSSPETLTTLAMEDVAVATTKDRELTSKGSNSIPTRNPSTDPTH